MSSKRAELKQNELAHVLDEKLAQLKPYTNVILFGALAIILVAVGISWWIISANQGKERMWGDFIFAYQRDISGRGSNEMDTVATAYGDKPAGIWATQLMADQKLAEGSRVLLTDRTRGQELLQEAVSGYTEVIASGVDTPLLQRAALYGRAQAYESLFELENARSDYNALVKQHGDTAIGRAAERRLALLEMPGLKEFQEQFVAFDPSEADPASQFNPATQGRDPSMQPLPPIPDLSFPEPVASDDTAEPSTPDTDVEADDGSTDVDASNGGDADPAVGDTSDDTSTDDTDASGTTDGNGSR